LKQFVIPAKAGIQPSASSSSTCSGMLAQCVGGAAQAGVVGADGDLDVVEQAFGEARPSKVWRATARTASFMAWLLCVVLTIRLHIE
jgi:hypothetical protein